MAIRAARRLAPAHGELLRRFAERTLAIARTLRSHGRHVLACLEAAVRTRLAL